MILSQSLASAGQFTKTHGIHGELNATLSIDPDFFAETDHFICEIEGIYVPFFIHSVRSKGSQALLLRPENVNSDLQAKPFVGKTIYIDKAQYAAYLAELADEDDYDTEGAFADDLIGYTVKSEDGILLGEVTDIETSTANTLFIVRTPADKTLYIPVADEFITTLDPSQKLITVSLPEGLIDLNT